MSFASAATLAAVQPRILLIPEGGNVLSESARVGLEICELAGLDLDVWQRQVFTGSLAERADRKWTAFEVAEVVARQNGKGVTLQARELAGAFGIDEERLIVHSAHEQATSTEHQLRLLDLIEGVPDFDARVQKVRRGKGEESIALKDGTRILFKTRTGGGGLGFTGDLIVFDEGMYLAAAFMAALVPTMAARSILGNPQLWYAGSAVDQAQHPHGMQLARVRRRGITGAPRLLYVEYSAHIGDPMKDDPATVPEDVRLDPDRWAEANPSLGKRISEEYVADEAQALPPREFCVQRLGIGSWPDVDGAAAHVISPEAWSALTDPASEIVGVPSFAFDVTPDRSHAAIGVAGRRRDGRSHVEIIEHREGTGWLIARAAALVIKHGSDGVLCDGTGPAGSLIPEFKAAGVKVTAVSATQHAQAAGVFYDAVDQCTVRHLGSGEMLAAVSGAVKRPLGDAWAWSRKSSGVDICPLVACTLALWGVASIDASQNIW